MKDWGIKKKRKIVRFGQNDAASMLDRRAIKETEEIKCRMLGKSLNRTIVSPAEKDLERFLKKSEVKFETQARIGKYCADFVLPGKVIVEVEGIFHESKLDKDLERTNFLEKEGYLVLRIPAYEAHKKSTAELIRRICAGRVQK